MRKHNVPVAMKLWKTLRCILVHSKDKMRMKLAVVNWLFHTGNLHKKEQFVYVPLLKSPSH